MPFAVLLAAHAILGQTKITNPAEIPVPQPGWEKRHAEKVEMVRKHKYDLLLIGDSTTHQFEYAPYKPLWDKYFAPRNTIDLAYSGARTENILWNLQNGELDNQSPKVATLMIGTNNADGVHFPTAHDENQIAGGIKAIVKLLREKLPTTKILLIRCFPFGERPNMNTRGDVLNKASEMSRKLVDNKKVFWLDVNEAFLNRDGSMNKNLMPDVLHPSPEGSKKWCELMEPTLAKLLGEKPIQP